MLLGWVGSRHVPNAESGTIVQMQDMTEHLTIIALQGTRTHTSTYCIQELTPRSRKSVKPIEIENEMQICRLEQVWKWEVEIYALQL